MKVELSVWAKTEFGFVNRAYDKSTSRHAISAHFYFGIHVRIVLKKSPKRPRIPTGVVGYDDKIIFLKFADGGVEVGAFGEKTLSFKDSDDVVDPFFDKLFERDTGRDLDCSHKLNWNLLA